MKTDEINMTVINYFLMVYTYMYMPLRARIFWSPTYLETYCCKNIKFCDEVIIGHYLTWYDYSIAMRLALFTQKPTSNLIWLKGPLK